MPRAPPRIIRARFAVARAAGQSRRRAGGCGGRGAVRRLGRRIGQQRRRARDPRSRRDHSDARGAAPARPAFARRRPARRAPRVPAGSADALALAQLAADCAGEKRLLAVVAPMRSPRSGSPTRLPWFAPGLASRFCPTGKRCPTITSRRTRTWCRSASRRSTTSRAANATCSSSPATTALYRLAPPAYLAAFTFFLKQGTRLDVDALRAQLALAGYQHVTQVVSPGEFSVRGGLIDLFPMGSALPYRLDLFDDDIESIKTFDVDTQRTLYPVPDVRLLPAREFPLDEAGRTRFRTRFREVFEGDPSRSPLYKDVSNGVVPGGIEYYLPLFFDATATLADYLPRGRGRRVPRRRRRRRRALLAGHRVALQAAARRQVAAAAAARRGVPAARRVQRRAQGAFARSRFPRRDPNPTEADAAGTVAAAARPGRPPRRRSARRAEALSRRPPPRAC